MPVKWNRSQSYILILRLYYRCYNCDAELPMACHFGRKFVKKLETSTGFRNVSSCIDSVRGLATNSKSRQPSFKSTKHKARSWNKQIYKQVSKQIDRLKPKPFISRQPVVRFLLLLGYYTKNCTMFKWYLTKSLYSGLFFCFELLFFFQLCKCSFHV